MTPLEQHVQALGYRLLRDLHAPFGYVPYAVVREDADDSQAVGFASYAALRLWIEAEEKRRQLEQRLALAARHTAAEARR